MIKAIKKTGYNKWLPTTRNWDAIKTYRNSEKICYTDRGRFERIEKLNDKDENFVRDRIKRNEHREALQQKLHQYYNDTKTNTI